MRTEICSTSGGPLTILDESLFDWINLITDTSPPAFASEPAQFFGIMKKER